MTAVEVLLDSTLVAFDDRIADVFDTGLDPFREPATAARFAVFGFSRTDLTAADARRTGFFIDFDFAFAFVAIGAATYKGYGSQSQDGLWKAICSIVAATAASGAQLLRATLRAANFAAPFQ